MILAPLSFLCGGWFFLVWLGLVFGAWVLGSIFPSVERGKGKFAARSASVWVLCFIVGFIALANGV